MSRKIQVLRGLAIIAVVIIHSCPGAMAGIFIRAIVNFAVAMFLFCSGYLTKTSYQEIGKFYKRRMIRVGIPYVIWSMAYTLAFAVRDGVYGGLLGKYFLNLIYGTASVPLYFIIVYILFTLWTPLIGKLAESGFRWIGLLITPVYMVLTTYIPVMTGQTIIPRQFTPFLRLQWFHFYYLGMILGNHLMSYKNSKKKTVLIYLCTLLISLAESFYWNHLGNYTMATTQARLGCVLSSSYACVMAFQYLEDEKTSETSIWEQKLAWMGDYSFGIYLLHVMVIGALGRVPGYGILPFPMNTLLILSITILGLRIGEKVFKGKLNSILGIRKT